MRSVLLSAVVLVIRLYYRIFVRKEYALQRLMRLSTLLRADLHQPLDRNDIERIHDDLEFFNFLENLLLIYLVLIMPRLWYRMLVRPIVARNQGLLGDDAQGENRVFLICPTLGGRLSIYALSFLLLDRGYDLFLPVPDSQFRRINDFLEKRGKRQDDPTTLAIYPELVRPQRLGRGESGSFRLVNFQDRNSLFGLLRRMRKSDHCAVFLVAVDPVNVKGRTTAFEFLGLRHLVPEAVMRIPQILGHAVTLVHTRIGANIFDPELTLSPSIPPNTVAERYQERLREMEAAVRSRPDSFLPFRLWWMWAGRSAPSEERGGDTFLELRLASTGETIVLRGSGQILKSPTNGRCDGDV